MPLFFGNTEIPAGAIITFGGSPVEKIIYDNVQVWQKQAQAAVLTGYVAFYKTGSNYPMSISDQQYAIGPTNSNNRGGIVAFVVDNVDPNNIDVNANCVLRLHFDSGASYFPTVAKILPDSKLRPYYDNNNPNSSSFSSFKNSASSTTDLIADGNDLTYTFSGLQLKTWLQTCTVTPSDTPVLLLTFGFRNNWNSPVLKNLADPPTLTYYPIT